jgi:hypothetical protein
MMDILARLRLLVRNLWLKVMLETCLCGGEESFGVGFVVFGDGKEGGSQRSRRFGGDFRARPRCVHLDAVRGMSISSGRCQH